MSLIVQLESARGHSELADVLFSGRAVLERCDRGLWNDFLTWAREVLVPMRFSDIEETVFESLREGMDMIVERLAEEREEWRQQALAEGQAKE